MYLELKYKLCISVDISSSLLDCTIISSHCAITKTFNEYTMQWYRRRGSVFLSSNQVTMYFSRTSQTSNSTNQIAIRKDEMGKNTFSEGIKNSLEDAEAAAAAAATKTVTALLLCG